MSTAVSFTVAKESFASAVAWVARNLPSRPAEPVLRGLVIDVVEDGLLLSGYDYELSTQVKLEAETTTQGRFAVAGKLLNDIVGNLPKQNIEVNVNPEKQRVEFSCGSAKFEIPLIQLDDYPKLPSLPEDTGSVNPALFAEAVAQVAVAAGKDEGIPMLTGLDMKIQGEQLILAATDRFRLAVRKVQWEPSNPDLEASLLIPARHVLENARAMGSSGAETISIAVGTGEQVGTEGLFGLRETDRKTTTRMLDAEFPNYNPLIPQAHKALAVVEIAALQDALRRVALVADRNSMIRMDFTDGELLLTARADIGQAEESVPCELVGTEDLTIAFNAQYLRDGLGALHSETVVFGFTEPTRAAILIPGDSPLPAPNDDGMYSTPETNFTYLLMPSRIPA